MFSHGIYSTMERPSEDYRATVARALAGRSVAGSATAFGLPRDAIRRVLRGHEPRLSRADAICRALGITFTIGTTRGSPGSMKTATALRLRDSVPSSGRGTYPSGRRDSIPIGDPQLAELLVRLAEHWEELGPPERDRLAAGIAAVLDLSGASGGGR